MLVEVPVATGPGDGEVSSAASRARLRASDADREQAIEVVKTAFAQGRLTREELGERTGRALTARTCAQVAAVIADIPAGMTEAPPARGPRSTAVKTGVRVITTATVPTAGLWAGACLAGAADSVAALLVMATLVWLGIVILTGAVMLQAYMYRPPLTG